MVHCVHTVRLHIGTRSGGSCVKPCGRPTPRGHWIHEGMYDRCQRQQGPVPAHSVILCACQRQPPSNPAPLLEGTTGSGTTWSAAWLRKCQHCSRPDDRHGLLGLMDKASDFLSDGCGFESRKRSPRRRGATTRKRRGVVARGGWGRHVVLHVHSVRRRLRVTALLGRKDCSKRTR